MAILFLRNLYHLLHNLIIRHHLSNVPGQLISLPQSKGLQISFIYVAATNKEISQKMGLPAAECLLRFLVWRGPV